ncbi:MAG: hypothetical protein ACI9F9_002054 [Candidatus Paceibacteria bacterium]|jgi:hypothetical protein
MNSISRRTVLRGLGVTLALPWFESLAPKAPQGPGPKRLLFVYVPNGIHGPDWQIQGKNSSQTLLSNDLPSELPKSLRELERHRDQFSVLAGLTLDKARNNGDGPGDHARAAAAFLTCSQPKKADGSVIQVGVSVDQVAAQSIGGHTRFRSLQLALEGGMQAGQCDSGYPCAYSSNLSWSTPHTPMVPETNPRVLFDRLFGVGLENASPQERARRTRLRKSVLDFVRKDARGLAGQLGISDRRKLDEYLEGIRELERRIDRASDPVAVALERPTGTPDNYAEHATLMFELLTLAFATDSTRVASFMMANEGSGRTYRELGLSQGHHTLSHHGGDSQKQTAIARINRFHLQLFGTWLDRLREVQEGGDSLLDETLVVYGSGIADGNSHAHHDIPLLLAGGGGSLPLGKSLAAPVGTPAADLHLRLLRCLGVKDSGSGSLPTRFGDSSGPLSI